MGHEETGSVRWLIVFVNLFSVFCMLHQKQDAPAFALAVILMLSDGVEESVCDFMKDAV